MEHLTDSATWKALQHHRRKMEDTHMRDLFAADDGRFSRFSLQQDGLLLDYSKHRITDETMALLLALAEERGVEEWRDKMFGGEKINASEDRAVLHTALRRPATESVIVDGENIMPSIHETLGRMKSFSDMIRSGAWKGHTGKIIDTVVHIGIGGSDLGSQMVCEALKNDPNINITVRFVSNVDGAHIAYTLRDLSPETTLFIVASKSFTTQETMANAATAREWIAGALGGDAAIARHFVAVSSNKKAAADFGIAPENIFSFGDWVGGRYSLWSAIGLPVCVAVGFDNFRALLDGAHMMDRHFCETPPDKNMPVILALLGVWYRNFWNAESHAVLPYSQNLHRLPAFLQQVDMESNGKSIDRNGDKVDYATGPIVFGEPGTNGQHAFYQLLHQGTSLVPCDFIGIVNAPVDVDAHHRLLLANMVAQTQALMQGRPAAESGGDPQKSFDGNRPSTTILLDRLDAFHLGLLLALYEHKTFVQGIIWNINSFDQWGVELGKVLANDILAGNTESADSSTTGLIDYIRARTD